MLGQLLAGAELLRDCHAGRIHGLYQRGLLGCRTNKVLDDPKQIREFLNAQPYALLQGAAANAWFNKDLLLYPGELVMMKLVVEVTDLEKMVEQLKDGTELYHCQRDGVGQAGGSACLYRSSRSGSCATSVCV